MAIEPVKLSEEYQSVYNRVSLLREDEARLIYAMGEIQREIMHLEMQRDTVKTDLQSAEARLSAVKSSLASTEAAYSEMNNALEIAKQNTMLEEKNKNIAIAEREAEEKKLSEIVLAGRRESEKQEERRTKLTEEITQFEERKKNLQTLLSTI